MLTVLPEQFIRHQGIGTIDCGCERLQSNLSHCSQAYQIAKATGAGHSDSPNIGMLSQSSCCTRFERPPVLPFGLPRDGFGSRLGGFVDLLSREAKSIPKKFAT
jgi:hypothetical protein